MVNLNGFDTLRAAMMLGCNRSVRHLSEEIKRRNKPQLNEMLSSCFTDLCLSEPDTYPEDIFRCMLHSIISTGLVNHRIKEYRVNLSRLKCNLVAEDVFSIMKK